MALAMAKAAACGVVTVQNAGTAAVNGVYGLRGADQIPRFVT